MRSRALNVGRRRRDPEGNYVAVTDSVVFNKLISKVVELGLDYEVTGDLVVIRGKSWSKMQRLINFARELGIEVLID
ncbi:hypothetical protein [Vulcanisaeta thermophila]|uniref:hypothetical protein n=1 Tax=Vulcanisaeta thermophila TaxID=867917 RepID=UPI00117C3B32|nr:hypothetical protein [Vulcanisaeta thermophila]